MAESSTNVTYYGTFCLETRENTSSQVMQKENGESMINKVKGAAGRFFKSSDPENQSLK